MCGTVYYAVQGGFIFRVCGWNPKLWSFKWKLPAVQGGSTFESVDEILKCAHFNKSYWAVLSVVLFIMLHTVFLTFELKAIEQYFPAVLFIILYKVVLHFEWNPRLVCWKENETNYRGLYDWRKGGESHTQIY